MDPEVAEIVSRVLRSVDATSSVLADVSVSTDPLGASASLARTRSVLRTLGRIDRAARRPDSGGGLRGGGLLDTARAGSGPGGWQHSDSKSEGSASSIDTESAPAGGGPGAGEGAPDDALPAWLCARHDFAALQDDYRRGSSFVMLALQTPPRLRNERELALIRRWLAPQRRFRGVTPELGAVIARALRVSVLGDTVRLWADSTTLAVVLSGRAAVTDARGCATTLAAGESFGGAGWWNLMRRGLCARHKALSERLAEVRGRAVRRRWCGWAHRGTSGRRAQIEAAAHGAITRARWRGAEPRDSLVMS